MMSVIACIAQVVGKRWTAVWTVDGKLDRIPTPAQQRQDHAGIQPLSALLPSTQAMQAIQGLAYGQETLIPPLGALAALAGGALFSFGLATYLFNWDTRNASRRGHPAMALLAWIPYALTMLAM